MSTSPIIPNEVYMDEFELNLKKDIDYFLSNYTPLEKGVVTAIAEKPQSTGEIKMDIRLYSDNTLGILMASRDDKNHWWSNYKDDVIKIPQTEEEHFQYSTVHDMYFSFEFFKYLTSVLSV